VDRGGRKNWSLQTLAAWWMYVLSSIQHRHTAFGTHMPYIHIIRDDLARTGLGQTNVGLLIIPILGGASQLAYNSPTQMHHI